MRLKPFKEFVDHQIAEGRYSSVSEYISELIRDDEKHKAEQRLETPVLEGLESEETELTRQDFDDISKKAMAQFCSSIYPDLTGFRSCAYCMPHRTGGPFFSWNPMSIDVAQTTAPCARHMNASAEV